MTPRRATSSRPQVEALEDRLVPTVSYFGGNVLAHVEAQALFLGNEWSSVPADAAQAATLDASLMDLTGCSYLDALTRAGYGVGRGSASPGTADTALPAPAPGGATISDASIRAEIQADISQGLLQAPDVAKGLAGAAAGK